MRRGGSGAHIEKVESCAVHIDQVLVRVQRQHRLQRIPCELEFGWVSIFFDDARKGGGEWDRRAVAGEHEVPPPHLGLRTDVYPPL